MFSLESPHEVNCIKENDRTRANFLKQKNNYFMGGAHQQK